MKSFLKRKNSKKTVKEENKKQSNDPPKSKFKIVVPQQAHNNRHLSEYSNQILTANNNTTNHVVNDSEITDFDPSMEPGSAQPAASKFKASSSSNFRLIDMIDPPVSQTSVYRRERGSSKAFQQKLQQFAQSSVDIMQQMEEDDHFSYEDEEEEKTQTLKKNNTKTKNFKTRKTGNPFKKNSKYHSPPNNNITRRYKTRLNEYTNNSRERRSTVSKLKEEMTMKESEFTEKLSSMNKNANQLSSSLNKFIDNKKDFQEFVRNIEQELCKNVPYYKKVTEEIPLPKQNDIDKNTFELEKLFVFQIKLWVEKYGVKCIENENEIKKLRNSMIKSTMEANKLEQECVILSGQIDELNVIIEGQNDTIESLRKTIQNYENKENNGEDSKQDDNLNDNEAFLELKQKNNLLSMKCEDLEEENEALQEQLQDYQDENDKYQQQLNKFSLIFQQKRNLNNNNENEDETDSINTIETIKTTIVNSKHDIEMRKLKLEIQNLKSELKNYKETESKYTENFMKNQKFTLQIGDMATEIYDLKKENKKLINNIESLKIENQILNEKFEVYNNILHSNTPGYEQSVSENKKGSNIEIMDNEMENNDNLDQDSLMGSNADFFETKTQTEENSKEIELKSEFKNIENADYIPLKQSVIEFKKPKPPNTRTKSKGIKKKKLNIKDLTHDTIEE